MHNPSLLFLVGLPRSGTKLLRDLLNRHSDIALLPRETHFIPYFARQFSRFGEISDRDAFARFYSEFDRTVFAERARKKGIVFNEADWYSQLKGHEFKDVMTAFFACFSARTGRSIVGDKTPEYLTQIPLLSELFPAARFIHIIRDPRDYVLSMRKARGKNMYRSAQRWKEQIRKYRSDVVGCAVQNHQVRYEDLLENPERVLTEVCDFLGVRFQDQMLSLTSPSETLGDARGQMVIVRDNSGKWKTQLDSSEVRRIESIAGSLMEQLGYETSTPAGDEDVSRLSMAVYKVGDMFNLFRFRVRQQGGVWPALALSYKSSLHSGLGK